jgi:hypothetical protein
MCSQKRGAKNQRREQSDSGRVGLRPQSESDSRRCERDTRERKIPRSFFFPFLFLFLIRAVIGESSRHGRGGDLGLSLVWPAIDLSFPPTPIGAGVSMSVRRTGFTLVVLGQSSHEVAL